jgi:hypothetical protein
MSNDKQTRGMFAGIPIPDDFTHFAYFTAELLCPQSPLLERRKFPAARMNV